MDIMSINGIEYIIKHIRQAKPTSGKSSESVTLQSSARFFKEGKKIIEIVFGV